MKSNLTPEQAKSIAPNFVGACEFAAEYLARKRAEEAKQKQAAPTAQASEKLAA